MEMQSRAPAHRNNGLFSDHYLDVTLPRKPGWDALAREAEPVLRGVRDLFRSFTPSANEAQTEQEIVRPVLKLLGHDFEVQPALSTRDGVKRPDYVFYRDAASVAANKDKTLDEDLLRGSALAVGDAKYWDRPLDAALRGEPGDYTNRNPSVQISFYLQQSGTEWAILTNGRLWRLYQRATAHRLDRFYEVDLHELATGGDAERFAYFHAFFRREAFDEHPLGLREILKGSEDYARNVGDSLKAQVYEALRHVAQGFLDHPPNGLAAEPGTLREVYDNALILLYRLLFVLYAESRGLLPVGENETYRDAYSLQKVKRDVAADLDAARALLPASATLWPRLKTLFGIIADGSPQLDVATFDGGLFDPERHPFLERFAVGDRHLQLAVDRLARVDGGFVDYRDLAERHLGTIYEGLLEFHLEALPEPEDGFTVALLNEGGERKATGSYYTPDFVVKHIVERAVGPLLQRAVADARTDEEKVRAVLALNVLDPSMGSGHFLVEVTEFVARFLVELGVPPEGLDGEDEAELAYWKRRVAQSCVYGVDLNPLAVDLAKLSLWLATVAKDRPLSFLDHHLRAGNALVGARISDLAPGGKRKRRGKKPAGEDGAQLSMASDPAFQASLGTAVGSMWLIEESPAESIRDVREQEQLYARLRETLTRRHARLADLSTAARLGLEVDPTLWRPLADYVAGRVAFVPPRFEEWLREAADLSADKRFFHWELEFPEVYSDRQGRSLGDDAGFDAVVGNPPYVRQESLGSLKPYLADAYPETYHGVADLYVYFYEQGLRQLKRGGRMSYIVTNKWLRAGYGAPLRAYFATEGALEEILDFGHAPIFPDADVFPCIVVLQKPGRDMPGGSVRVAEFPRAELGRIEPARFVAEKGHDVPRARFGEAAWSLEPRAVSDLMQKVRERGIPLADYAGAKPLYGIKTGLNEAFLIDTPTRERLVREDGRSAEVIKPYLRGQDVKRWSPEWRGLWMIVLKSSGDHPWPWRDAGDEAEDVFRQTYPALHAHMKPLEEKLRKRRDKGRHWWELRSCAYYDAFERPKIMYSDITWRSSFSFDGRGQVFNNTVYFLPTDNVWLFTILNSPLMWWFCWREAVHGKDEALRLFSDFVQRIPIAPPATDADREEAEAAVGRLAGIAAEDREARRDLLEWLRVEFGVVKPGQKLEDPAGLEADAFVEEVRKRRPKDAARLTPAALRELREAHAQTAAPARGIRAEAAALERRLSDGVYRAYNLTDQETALLWSTAPPRMPRA